MDQHQLKDQPAAPCAATLASMGPAATASRAVPPTSIESLVPPSSHPKKARLLRRLIDFFHHFGSPHHPQPDDAIVPASLQRKKQQLSEPMAQVPQLASPPPLKDVRGGAVEAPRFYLRLRGLLSRHHEHDGSLHSQSCSPSSCSEGLKPRHHRRTSSKHSAQHAEEICELGEAEIELIKSRVIRVRGMEDLSFDQKYRLADERVIGKGASGVVRLGYRVATEGETTHSPKEGEPLAIKEFRKRRKGESMHDYLVKLTSEFTIASQMSHANVVQTLDIVYDGRRWYEVMEYCCNGDLFNYIHAGGLEDRAEVDCCFRQLVEGVWYLHELGIAHRDLKPENLLVDGRGRLKITDFGVSCSTKTVEHPEEVRLCKGLCGSSPYIAPESYSGQAYDGNKVDVWSLGIIYYAMVFHGVPWEAAHERDSNFVHYLNHREHFEPFNRLPSGCRSLLRKLLEPDPAKRITVKGILEDDWFKSIEIFPLPPIPPAHHHHH